MTISKNTVILISVISTIIVIITVIASYFLLFHKDSKNTNPIITPQPSTPPYISKQFLGCKDSSPDIWKTPLFTSKEAIRKSCNTNGDLIINMSESELQKAEYSQVFWTSGKHIYEDVYGDENHSIFWNYGDFTSENSQGSCVAEPTETSVYYANKTDAVKNSIVEIEDDSLIIWSKPIPKYDKDRTSVRIQTVQSFTYGLFVFCLSELPSNSSKTVWPAAWLTAPFDCRNGKPNGNAISIWGGWALCGEYDIFEMLCSEGLNSAAIHVPCRNTGNSINVQKKEKDLSKPGYYCGLWTPRFLKTYYVPLNEGRTFFSADNASVNLDDLEKYNTTSSNQIDPSKPEYTNQSNGWIPNGGSAQSLPFNSGQSVVGNKVDMVVKDGDGNNDITWTRSGDSSINGNPKCFLPNTAGTTKYPGVTDSDYLKQKKEAQFNPLTEKATEAGGFQIIINIATIIGSCQDRDPTGPASRMKIDSVSVYQIV
jgi:hypothetical protein